MIPVKNIYYMLTYAFSILRSNGYKHIETEKFENTAELFASILATGTAIQVKRGLIKEYQGKQEAISSPKGKIHITSSLRDNSLHKKQLVCSYDEFISDSYMNQILKSTLLFLVKQNISLAYKKQLRKVLVFFEGIKEINLKTVNWKLCYNKNNQSYKMLLSLCYLTVKGLLQTTHQGNNQLMDFIDEQHMHRLYEKFILEYYRKEWPQLSANATQIPWVLDNDYNELLPIMQTDITLIKGNKILIIDAKYYANTLQYRHDKGTIHSGNLYQIFTYVKNKELSLKDNHCTVAGMLLYAKTDDGPELNNAYSMSGSKISVRTIDLNCDFRHIKKSLDEIAGEL